MTPVEAMEWAADYAERHKLFEVPQNSRGYPVDGHKHLSASEKAEIIISIAKTVTTEKEVSA